jgi:uncharacterized protein
MGLRFRQLPGTFVICRLPSDALPPQLAVAASFTSITRTEDELSIVCRANQAPGNAKREAPWICFKLEGPFPFSQTGVLASFINPLAEHGVPIFAISTFNTDYVLVKEEHAEAALHTLRSAGHEMISSEE